MAHRNGFCLAKDTRARRTSTIFASTTSNTSATTITATATLDSNRELQTKNTIQSQVRSAIKAIVEDLKKHQQTYNNIKKRYNNDRKVIIGRKAGYIATMIDRLKNKSQFAKLVKLYAEQLRRYSIIIVNHYVSDLATLIAALYKEQTKLDSQLSLIFEYTKNTKYNQKHFSYELKDISKKRTNVQKVIKGVSSYKAYLESTVYGTMCFDVIGATGKIKTKKEEEEFQELTQNVIEIACGELGVDADLVLMQIVKQKFVKNKRRRLNQVNNIEEDGEPRELGKLRDAILRVATVIGIDCNCEDVDPVSDVWSRNLRKEYNGDEEEEEDILMREWTLMLGEQDDGKDALDNSLVLLGERNRTFASPNDIFRHDALYQEDRQLFRKTIVELNYIEALQKAFDSLKKVVEVKQISCVGFLSEAEALKYIHGFA